MPQSVGNPVKTGWIVSVRQQPDDGGETGWHKDAVFRPLGEV